MVPLILIVVGILLIVANLKLREADKVKTSSSKNEEKQESFSEVFQEKHDNISNEQLQIGEIRKDVAESLTELQREILDIKNSIKSIKNRHKYYDNKIKALQKTISEYEKKEQENESKRESQNKDLYDDIGDFDNQANERKYLLDIYKEDLNDTVSEPEKNEENISSKPEVLEDEKIIEASDENINDNSKEQMDEEIVHEEIVHNEEDKNIDEEVNTIIPDKKAEKIKMLLEEGIEEKEICRILSVTNGEVELVKGLIKNEDAKKS